MLSFLSGAATRLTGTGAPLLFFFSGIVITCATGGVQFRRFFPALLALFREKGAPGVMSPRRALLLALGAVMGPGNLIGVSAAVALGGPGAVFWMWLSGVVGMALRYAETSLSLCFGKDDPKPEGMVSVIRRGLGSPGLALFFALAGTAVSLLMADLTSSGVLIFSLRASCGFPVPLGALLLVFLMLPILWGGSRRIEKVSPFLTASVSLLFLALSLVVFLRAPAEVIRALRAIFSSAFRGKSLLGLFFSPAFREGIRKGIYSNECGLGSEPAFSRATSLRDPARQGEISMLGPFLDTAVFCGISGVLCVMSAETDPIRMLPALFDRFFPDVGAPLVTVFLALLVYTTVISWYYAGEGFALSAFGPRAALPFRIVYLITPLFAPLFSVGALYVLTDLAVAVMAFPSLASILLLTGRVRKISGVTVSGGGTRRPR